MRAQADASRSGRLLLPRYDLDPIRAIALRVAVGCGVLLLIAVLVWLDRESYSDIDDDVNFIDAVYYATVSASTTGFGEIAPTTQRARTLNIFVITPLRVVFLAVLIGTTLEVLTRTGRERLKVARWQRAVSGHTVIVGFGTKGKAAADQLLRDGARPGSIIAVADDPDRLADAAVRRIVGVDGDGSRDDVLLAAVVDRASCVIVAVPDDAAAVLVTLTARRLNPTARIVAAVKATENAELLRHSGADGVMISADVTGRQLAAGLTHPAVGRVYGQLLDPGHGLELTERQVQDDEVGRRPSDLSDLVIGVVRSSGLMPAPLSDIVLADGDRLVLLDSGTG